MVAMSEDAAADSLALLLASVSLEEYLPTLEEEEMTVQLLRSMSGSVLLGCLEELGLKRQESKRLADALAEWPPKSASASMSQASSPCDCPTPESPAATNSSSFAQRVLELQQELFCEDLEPPPEAEAWSDARLRAYFESGGANDPFWHDPVDTPSPVSRAAPPPSSSSAATPRSPSPSAAPPPSSSSAAASPGGLEPTPWQTSGFSPAVCAEPVGALTVRWQGVDYSYPYGEATTVGDLKAYIQQQTHVAMAHQKLMGWASRKVGDVDVIHTLKLSAKRLMLMGTPSVELEAAAKDLERGKRTNRVANDLFFKVPEAAAACQ